MQLQLNTILALAGVLAAGKACAEESAAAIKAYFSHLPAIESRTDVQTLRPYLLLRPLDWRGAAPVAADCQPFYLHLFNDSDAALENISVELSGLGQPLAGTATRLEPNRYTAVKLSLKPSADPPAGPPPDAAKPIDKFPHPFSIVLKKGDEEIARRASAIEILHPKEYLAVDRIEFTSRGGEDNALTVRLRRTQSCGGPPCVVSLEMSDEDIPGYLGRDKATGSARLSLAETPVAGDRTIALHAERLKFKVNSLRQGRIFIAVDGFSRAFVYHVVFEERPGSVQPNEAPVPSVRFRHKDGLGASSSWALKSEKYAFRLTPENLDLGETLTIRLEDQDVLKYPGSRQRQAWRHPPAADGALLLRGEVREWVAELDVAMLDGPKRLEAQSGRGGVLGEHVFTVTNVPPSISFRKTDAVRKSEASVELTMLFDVDKEHPAIDSVAIYLGKRVEAGVEPRGLVPAERKDADKWVVPDLKLPDPTAQRLEFVARIKPEGGGPFIDVPWSVNLAAAPLPRHNLRVVVRGTDRLLLDDALVQVAPKDPAKSPWKAESKRTGRSGETLGVAEFAQVPEGDYIITVSRGEVFPEQSQTFELRSQNRTCNVVLRRKGE